MDALIDACRVNDRKAQYEVYKLYAKSMLNVSMRIVNDLGEAEDILQESFVKAFMQISSFKGESTFGAWLKRIVVNLSISRLKQKKWQRLAYEETAAEDLMFSNKDFDEDFQYELKIDEVRKAIQELPDGFRVIFSLYLLEGYDHAEIAEILGISESTSKSQYNRAKKKLRQVLDAKRFEV